jgi:hypothetical protein
LFDKDELRIIHAVLANAEFKGIQAAAMVVKLFHKVDNLIKDEFALVESRVKEGFRDLDDQAKRGIAKVENLVKEEFAESGKSANASDRAQSGPDQSAGADDSVRHSVADGSVSAHTP